jgi:hypothetical protein
LSTRSGQLLDPDDWLPRPNLGLFVVRFPSEVDPGDAGWHIDSSFEAGDGNWSVNYRSRERGLLPAVPVVRRRRRRAPPRILRGSHLQMPSPPA